MISLKYMLYVELLIGCTTKCGVRYGSVMCGTRLEHVRDLWYRHTSHRPSALDEIPEIHKLFNILGLIQLSIINYYLHGPDILHKFNILSRPIASYNVETSTNLY